MEFMSAVFITVLFGMWIANLKMEMGELQHKLIAVATGMTVPHLSHVMVPLHPARQPTPPAPVTQKARVPAPKIENGIPTWTLE